MNKLLVRGVPHSGHIGNKSIIKYTWKWVHLTYMLTAQILSVDELQLVAISADAAGRPTFASECMDVIYEWCCSECLASPRIIL